MNSYENSVKEYQSLNKLAKSGGVVVMGGDSDLFLPVGELRESFGLETTVYNRSVAGLTVGAAADFFDACVAPLKPSCLLVRLGEAEPDSFTDAAAAGFVRDCRSLVEHIRSANPKCEVVLLSMNVRGAADPERAEAVNEALRAAAKAANCGFEDVDALGEGSLAACESACFVYSIGFVAPLPVRTPVHNLVRILYGYGNVGANLAARQNKDRGQAAKRLNVTAVSLF